jgi:2-(3-amino-3-carboxypropyl)histidine synthase
MDEIEQESSDVSQSPNLITTAIHADPANVNNEPEKRPMKVVKRIIKQQPWEKMLEENKDLQKALKILPSNYDFEIPKCIYKIKEMKANLVALQFPEGLLMFSCAICDIIRDFTQCRILILSDVTYGACCVDDYSAAKLEVDLLIHYGHSCLVPIQQTKVKTLYVFVEISFVIDHLIEVLIQHFPSRSIIAIQGTVQFLRAVQETATHPRCRDHFQRIDIPQVKPLSRGETLGCTAAILAADTQYLVFIADGRFHMEAAMIRNAKLFDSGQCQFFKYDPYGKKMTREVYDHHQMMQRRSQAIQQSKSAKVFGLILGTLGHQGNIDLFHRLQASLQRKQKTIIPFLMAELSPKKLAVLSSVVEVWIQVACPRLSIDWAAQEYAQPVLTPYECMVAMEEVEWQATYPMDYYSNEKSKWSNYFPPITLSAASARSATDR